MRVIICGAGQVGYSIASYLAHEENDVTVIDINPQLIAEINDDLDVSGIVGHASNPDVLNAAGARDAELMIAVTQGDEVNMVACQIGHSLFGIPKKIARVREQAYLQPAWSNLFSRAHMPIDVIISPELVVAQDICRRLSVPGTLHVAELADGAMHVLGVICGADCPVINTPLDQLRALFPDLMFRVVAIMRKNRPIFPDDKEQILPGDEVYFIAETAHMRRVMAAFGHEEKEARRIVIAGGGNVGYGLAALLRQAFPDIHIKMIERNPDRAVFLSETLVDIVTLNGSSLDKDILEEAGLDHAEIMVAVTNDDESNILGSLLAKQYGCERVITLVNNPAYGSLLGPLGIDVMVSPRATIVSTIMQHVRRGRIRGLTTLRDGFAEVMEIEISDASKLANTTLSDLDLPSGVVIGAILRDEKPFIPAPRETLRPGDIIIIVSAADKARWVEKLFSVQVDIF